MFKYIAYLAADDSTASVWKLSWTVITYIWPSVIKH